MVRKGKNNNPNNRLLYDPNQRAQRRLGAFSNEENLDDEELSENVESDSQKFDDDFKEESDNQTESSQEETNSLQSNKSSIGKNVKNVSNDVGKKVASVAGKVSAKIGAFILANPWVLVLLFVGVFFILIILFFSSSDESYNGYYDTQCDFNISNVSLKACGTEDVVSMTLEEYVLGATNALIVDNNYSDETIKAIMIVLKTNALSYGNYDSSTKSLSIDDCSYSFVNLIESDKSYDHLKEIYDSISNYIYLSTVYDQAITSLSIDNALSFDETIIDKMEALALENGTFSSILSKIYNGNSSTINYNSSIFIGDSNVRQMQKNRIISDISTIYGNGLGYDWFIGNGSYSYDYTNSIAGGIAGANSKMNPDVIYNIFIWLGINDLDYISAEVYYNKYLELANGEWSNHNIYIIELGPVDENSTTIRNSSINSYNNALATLISSSGSNNLYYLDLDYDIMSYEEDGVLYSVDDYKKIYSMITKKIVNSADIKYRLYNLDDYCEYIIIEESSYSNLCDAISISTTSFSRSEFIEKVQDYFSDKKTDSAKVFYDNAGVIYDIAVKNGVNPELVVIRAISEGFSPGVSKNNYWGLGCYNTGGTSACITYNSFDAGVLAFVKNISKYDSVSSMMSKYAYIGKYWYNPGSWSVGGCKYFSSIEKYLTPPRASEVSKICSSDKTCTTAGESSCVLTTDEDQLAYAKWQVEGMSVYRKNVFGIDADVCDEYSANCKIFAQNDSRWNKIHLGSSSLTIGDSGCAVTSIAIGISCSGTKVTTESFDPGVFVNELNANNCFTSSGAIEWACSGISKVAPSVHYVTQFRSIKSETNAQKIDHLNAYSSGNYFIIVHFKNTSFPRGHYVVYTSVSGDKIMTKDPAGGKINSLEISEIDQIVVYAY